MSNRTFMVSFVLLLGVIVACTVMFIERLPPLPDENGLGEECIRGDDRNGQNAAVATELKSIRTMFNSLAEARRAEDGTAIRKWLRFDILCWRALKIADIRDIGRSQKQKLVQILAEQLSEQYGRPFSPIPACIRTDIRSLRFSRDRKTAVVYGRHWMKEGNGEKLRWWLTKDGNLWYVYDLENLRFGGRLSEVVGIGVRVGRKGDPATTIAIQKFALADRFVASGLGNLVADQLASTPKNTLPWLYEQLRLALLASIRCDQRRYSDVLQCSADVHSTEEGFPVFHYLSAIAHNGLGEYQASLDDVGRYVKALPRDDEICYQEGVARAGLGEQQAAERAFRRGLSDNPASAPNMLGLLLVLPAERRTEAVTHLNELKTRKELFQSMAEELTAAGDRNALLLLDREYKRMFPGEGGLDYRLPKVGKKSKTAKTFHLKINPQPLLDILPATLPDMERPIRRTAKSATVQPASAAEDDVYVTKAGDTLSAIARKFKTSARKLQELNNISDANRLRTGTKLRVR